MTRASKTFRAQVTLRALIQRLNRRLASKDREIRSPRGRGGDTRVREELGDYFIVNPRSDELIERHVKVKDLEKMARDLDAIRAWEEVQR
jgi:hypothetical protein